MPDTGSPYFLRYPALTDAPHGPNLGQNLAEDVRDELVRVDALIVGQRLFSDIGFPAAVSVSSTEGVVDRYTIAAKSWARTITVAGHVYTTNTQSDQQHDAIWYAGSTVIGRARAQHPTALAPTTLSCFGTYSLPASTSVVMELRVFRISGTGIVATSISGGLTSTICIATPA